MTVHLHLLADNRRISVEALLPVTVAKYDHVLRRGQLGPLAVDQDALRRLESQVGEEISAHVAEHNRFGAPLVFESGQSQGIGHHVGESIGLGADVLEVGVRKMRELVATLLLPAEYVQTGSVRDR